MCSATTPISLERGTVVARCTLENDHKGDHYDDVFLWAWKY